jgi:hypothetical protein
MNALLKKLKIDETYTKPLKKPIWDSVKQNTYPKQDYNFMADVLFLPETKEKFKYLLVVVDLWSDEFDIEPIKNKEPQTILDAMKTMFKRKHIKEPYASIRTDDGNEFKGVFHKYLNDNNILHRVGEPGRHQQLANVENLNRTLGRLLNGYMNSVEEATGKVYREWTDVIDVIRTDLNELRKKPDGNIYKMASITDKEPTFKIGDVVIRKSEKPRNALGNIQPTSNFRVGDYRWDTTNPRKIIKVLYYPNNIRYVLNGFPNVSYTENELKRVKSQEKYAVRQLIGKKKERNVTYYLVWWRKYKKSESTWEKERDLIEDGLKFLIDKFNSDNGN